MPSLVRMIETPFARRGPNGGEHSGGLTMSHHATRYRGNHSGRWHAEDDDTGDDSPRGRVHPLASLMVCDTCGSANPKYARACQECGTDPSGHTCVRCGAELLGGAQFLDECGRPQ